MGIFSRTQSGPPPVTREQCDRCRRPGRVRVAKFVVAGLSLSHVESQELDLVFCGEDFGQHQPALNRDGWRVVEAAR